MIQKGPHTGLLGIILLLVISVSIIHGKKATIASPGTEKLHVTVDDALSLIDPLLISKSFDAAAHALSQLDQATIVSVIQTVIADESYLDKKEQALLMLFLIADLDNQSLHMQLYKLLKGNYVHEPIYAYGILRNAGKGIERVYKLAQKYDRSLAKTWAEKSFSYAIKINKVEILDQLYSLGIRVSPEFASQLLHDVVMHQKTVDFVPLLVRTMQADPNYSDDGLKTVLIPAVELKNEPMVRALLEQGADPKKMLDEEVGTALQAAYENGDVVIEELLQEFQKK